MRITLLAVAMALFGSVLPASAQAVIQHYQLNIPRQPLDTALRDFANQTGLQIARMSDAVNGNTVVGPLNGDLSADEALKLLLTPRGLSYKMVNERTVAVMTKGEAAARAAAAGLANTGQPDKGGKAQDSGKEKSPKGDRFRVAQASQGASAPATAVESAESSSGLQPATLEEVVVTAQKRQERLQNVPISISVLSGQSLDRSTVQGVSEALNAVPGVATTDVYLGGGTNIEIRGVGAAFPLYTGPSAVAYYLDSVPFGLVKSAVGPDADAYDLERVEVLRGPQGTLYGSSALNGVVRILTNDPDLSDFDLKMRGSDSGTVDGSNNYRGDATINVPLVEGALAARATVGYLHDGGWIDQPNKSNANDTNVGTYRLKLRAQPTQDLSIGLSAWSSRQNSGAPNLGYTFDKNASLLAQPTSTDYDAYGLKIGYQSPWFSISSMTSYLDYKNYGYLGLDVPGLGVPGSVYFSALTSHVASQELNVVSTTSGPWHWSVGGMYRNGTEGGSNFFTVIPVPGGVYKDRSKSYAIYGEITRTFFDDHLGLTVGLRHFHDDLSQDAANTSGPPLTGSAAATSAQAEANTPRALATWHVGDHLMLYGSYSQGFRSGFPQTAGILQAVPDFPPVKPDRLTNYELGAKGDLLGGRIAFDTSVYHIVWNGIQLLAAIPVNGVPAPGVVNAARATGDGIDFSLTAKLADRLIVSPYVSWNNLGIRGNVISSGDVLYHDGERPSGSAETTAGLSIEYSFPISTSGALGRFSVSGNYTSAQAYRTIAAQGLLIQDSDAVVVARARFTVDFSDHWAATLYGDNLNNFKGVTAIMFPGVVPNWEGRLRPLTVGLQVEYHLH